MAPEDDPKKEFTQQKQQRKPKNFIFLLLFLILILMIFIPGKGIMGADTVGTVHYKDYLDHISSENHEVEKVEIFQETEYEGFLLATMKDGDGWTIKDKKYRKIRVLLPKIYLAEKVDELSKNIDPKKVEFKKESRIFYNYILPMVPWLLIIFFMYWFFFRQMRASGGPGNVLSFGKSRARFVTPDKVKTSFDDVAGVDEAKDEVKEIIEFLKDPQKFQRLGGRIPRGVLLVGAPGTGKTLLAKAIAGEASVPFLSISGSDFVEMFVGVGASRVRDVFKTAKENSPCIIFLDEIDAVGRRRGTGLGGGHDEREQTLNQILVEMDGFDTDTGVIIIAATNRPDVLDPALLRPGRFDRQIAIDLPDVKGREEILRVHAKKVRLDKNVDLKVLARATPMFSGADLASLINEAAILATMKRKEQIAMDDLEEARDKVLWGRQKKSRVVVEEERKVAAYHEAGHTLVASLQKDCDPVHKVTIIPRGRMGGATMSLPEKDRHMISKNYCEAQIAVLYGGRLAEELFFPDISSGAQDDIRKATDLARRMITEWGMTEALGPISYNDEEEHLFLGREVSRTQNHSEEIAQKIDKELRRIVDEGYARARKLIEDNRDKLETLAQALLKYETLTGDEVRSLLRGESIAAAKEKERREEKEREDRVEAEEKKPASEGEEGWKPLPGPQGA